MNNSQVAHLWANKSKQHANGSNFFFEGGTIYSYGRHFPIAKHVQISGEDWIVYNGRRYSPSTSRHQSYVRGAIAHDTFKNKTIYVSETRLFETICREIVYGIRLKGKVDAEGHFVYRKVNKRDIARWEKENLKRAAAREKAYHERRKENTQRVLELLPQMRLHLDKWIASDYSAEFIPPLFQIDKWDGRVKSAFGTVDATVFDNVHYVANKFAYAEAASVFNNRVAEKKLKELEEQRRINALTLAEKISDWRNGGTANYHGFYDVPCMLRLSSDKKRIQTSKGAEILTSFAVKAWPSMKLAFTRWENEGKRDTEVMLNAPDFHWGNFKGIMLYAQCRRVYLKVGCHDIPFTEIEAIAKTLDLPGA